MGDRPNVDGGTISIKLSRGHETATAFHVSDGVLTLHNHGRAVLSHRISGAPNGPHFWSNETDGPRSLAWTVDVELYRQGKQNISDRPIYHFTEQSTYERFQSECRNLDFITEFVTDSIKVRGKPSANTVDCNVKIWRTRKDKAGSITLPINIRGDIVQEELQCIWLDVRKDKGHSNQTHITFKANKSKKSSFSHGRSESRKSTNAVLSDR